MTRGAASPHAGFLLADMLVTLTISAFVLVGLTSLGGVMLRTADRSVAAIQTTDDLARAMASFSQVIRNAARARFAGLEPQPFIFNGDSQRLMLAKKREGSDPTLGLEILAFRSQDSGQLLRADSPLPMAASAPGDLPFGPAHAIYDGPARFRFSYLSSADLDSKPSWLSFWPIGTRMPQAVAVEAVDASSLRVLRRIEVPIMADTDLGCVSGGFCGRSMSPDGSAPAPSAGPSSAASNSSSGAVR